MPKTNNVILTEGDLQLLDNALLFIAEECRLNAISTGVSDVDKIMFRDSARDYDELRARLESADTIELEQG